MALNELRAACVEHGQDPSTQQKKRQHYDSYLVTTVVTEIASSVDQQHVTLRLSLKLAAGAANIYTIFGEQDAPLRMPRCWQMAPGPMGVAVPSS